MTSKYELTISTNYVQDWTFVEAFREIFQNALDNEIMNKDNKMLLEFNRENETVRICNKHSVLEINSLLLGYTTKADEPKTIGKHGEGYKVAIVVLLREGKTVTIYNYSKREIWRAKLVKSRRFNDLIPVISVEKEAVWKKIPDNDLTIEVGGVTEDEYAKLQEKNINIRDYECETYTCGAGSILLDEAEGGNLYVKGLFINHMDNLKYGYNFNPDVIKLDRDRRLLASFDVEWQTSGMWASIESNTDISEEFRSKLVNMGKENILDNKADTQYITYRGTDILNKAVVSEFKQRNGEKSIPVENNEQYNKAKECGFEPIIATSRVVTLYRAAVGFEEFDEIVKGESLKDRLQTLVDKIESKLSDEELEEITDILSKMTE